MTALPFIDTHSVTIDAPAEQIWDTITRTLERQDGAGARLFARLLGCKDTRAPVGFHVADAEHPNTIALQGRHRFSRYELRFVIGPDGRLSAETRAAFPGLHGAVYRALVIGSGAHQVIVRRMLGALKRRSER